MDLIDLRHYTTFNDGVQYLLTIIDVFSKYAMVFPLKTKQGKEVAKILKIIFGVMKPRILLSDNGKEFLNSSISKITNKFQVYHITSYSYTPLGQIERFNKTIKSKIFAYMNINSTQKYIDVLDLILQNYNKTKHSTTKDQPSFVHFCNDRQQECVESRKWIYQHLQNIDEKINIPVLNQITLYSIGNAVRVISYLDPTMTKKKQFVAYFT